MSDPPTTLPETTVTAKRYLPTPPIPPQGALPSPAPVAPPATVSTPPAIPQPQFIKRKIDLTFQLANNVNAPDPTFTETNSGTIKVSGLRVAVNIAQAGMDPPSCLVQVWGLTFDQMNKLSTLGRKFPVNLPNRILIEAGDAQAGMTKIFTGQITAAFMDARGMPNVSFQIVATSMYFYQLAPAQSTSLKGPVNVATQMQVFARQMGLTFENRGVDMVLPSVHLSGPLADQVAELAAQANIWRNLELDRLTIGPLEFNPSQFTDYGPIPLISPESGLIGYPTFASMGIEFTCLFNPALHLWDWIQMKSDLQPACGRWQIIHLSRELASEQPDGPWFANVFATSIDSPRAA
jgi:hypothetical protein